MIRKQYVLDLNGELLVDNFAGGGGASTGIELALGRHVDHARNHNAIALGMHRINHPQTVHHCEDIFESRPELICGGRRVGLAHFSPDCTHFSKAKGGMPLDKRIRGLVLEMLRWAKYGARVMSMENVEEIVTWGPLKWMMKKGVWGWWPDPKFIGRTWRAFLDILSVGIDPDHPDLPEILEILKGYITKAEAVRGFAYVFGIMIRRASTLGTPTIRKRLYMVARNDGQPIVWPEDTHNELGTAGLKPFRTIAECLDFSLPTPSIFLTRVQARKWRCKRPLVRATLRRLAKGTDRYILKAKRPFIISFTHQGGDRVESVDEPGRVVTCANRGEKGLCVPFVTEHANGSKQRNMPVDEPGRTICGEVKGGHFALAAGTVVKLRGDAETHAPGHGVDEPGHTVSAGGKHQAFMAAALTKFCTGSTGQELTKPGPTVTAGNHRPETRGGAASVQGLIAASIVRQFGESVGQECDKPGPTVMPNGGGKTEVMAAFLAQNNDGFNTNPGHAADGPGSTINSTGSQQSVVLGHCVKYYGTDQDPRMEEPAHTVRTKDHLGLGTAEAVSPMTEDQIAGARRVAAFLREFGVEFEGEFATVEGFVIVDLGMRMLTPRELFRVQGFSDAYVIDKAWVIDPKTGENTEVKLTKEQQIRLCGNSVCPQVMAAIVRCNVPELATWYRGEKVGLS